MPEMVLREAVVWTGLVMEAAWEVGVRGWVAWVAVDGV